MQERAQLFHSCAMAEGFRKGFAKADPLILQAEIKALHEKCPKEVTVQSFQIHLVCTCFCHQENANATH